jgi:hypothetical protein
MIPLYGFLQGDTIGLLILADDDDTAKTLADKLAAAARVRVEPRGPLRVFYKGRELHADVTVARARIEALDRIDAVEDEVQ